MLKRPLLAGTVKDFEKIKFPVIASPKLDGIRCLIVNGCAVSRNFKEIPNTYVRKLLEKKCANGLDGELIIPGKNFNDTQSAIMSYDGKPVFEYHVFDYFGEGTALEFTERLKFLQKKSGADIIKVVEQVQIEDLEMLKNYEEICLAKGYEGVMIRSLTGPYKEGRSTEREGILLKIKRFKDAEALVVGFVEKEHNENEKELDAFGLAKRSSKKQGKSGADTLGALQVEYNGIEFNIGTGFDDALRKEIWDHQEKYLMKVIKFKYQEMGKEAPRFPVFLGFRDRRDMS